MPAAKKTKFVLKKGRGKQVDKIVFDEEARREYLTGFHKRKVQKKEAEKKAAIAKQKRLRRENRAENRQLLAEQARENARVVEQAYGKDIDESDDAEDARSESEPADPFEFEDEEQVATVTIVEDFNVHDSEGDDGPASRKPQQTSDKSANDATKTKKFESAPKSSSASTYKKKKKRADFHYTTKSERLQERAKQLAGRKRGDESESKRQTRRRRVK